MRGPRRWINWQNLDRSLRRDHLAHHSRNTDMGRVRLLSDPGRGACGSRGRSSGAHIDRACGSMKDEIDSQLIVFDGQKFEAAEVVKRLRLAADLIERELK